MEDSQVVGKIQHMPRGFFISEAGYHVVLRSTSLLVVSCCVAVAHWCAGGQLVDELPS